MVFLLQGHDRVVTLVRCSWMLKVDASVPRTQNGNLTKVRQRRWGVEMLPTKASNMKAVTSCSTALVTVPQTQVGESTKASNMNAVTCFGTGCGTVLQTQVGESTPIGHPTTSARFLRSASRSRQGATNPPERIGAPPPRASSVSLMYSRYRS